MKNYKKLLKNAKEYLSSLDEKLKDLNGSSDDFYEAMKEFYDFFNEFNNIRARNIDDLIIPQDMEELLDRINSEFKIKNFKDDKKAWLEHIEDSLYRLMNLPNTIPKSMNSREKRVIKDSVERHHRQLEENIEYYEKMFGPIDKDIKNEMTVCLYNLRKKYNIYIRTKEDLRLAPLLFNAISFDDALNLYEEIKNTKHWKRKEKLQKQLNNLIKILEKD